MQKVEMTYEFTLLAGRKASTPESMAKAAREQAQGFYGDIPHVVTVEVRGRKEQYQVECVARAIVDGG